MIVIFTDEAERDLEQIGDYIAQDNPRRALTFLMELSRKCEELAKTPLGWPLVARYEQHGIRRRVHGNYCIFYRVDSEQIVIVHILNGAMDYAAILLDSLGE